MRTFRRERVPSQTVEFEQGGKSMQNRRKAVRTPVPDSGYGVLVSGISHLLEEARRSAAQVVNRILTTTYWEVGRRIVEFEQGGEARAEYGEALIPQLARDLTGRFGRGFGAVNLSLMRRFYLLWPPTGILQTPSEKLPAHPAPSTVPTFPLPWSHYVRLLSVENVERAGLLRGRGRSAAAGRSGSSTGRSATQFFERTSALEAARPHAGAGQKSEAGRRRDRPTTRFATRTAGVSGPQGRVQREPSWRRRCIRHLEWFLLELGAA